MKILFLDQFSELWGAQRCLLDLLPAVAEHGWHATVALPGKGPLIGRLRAAGAATMDIPCGPYRPGTKSLADIRRFRSDLKRQVEQLRPQCFDLIYVNGPRLLPAAAEAFGGRAPVLFHAHNRIPPGPSTWLARRSLRRSHATVMACARAVAPQVVPAKLRVIANGTADLGFRERSFLERRIGIIGRISREKGQVEFLRAAALARREFPDARFSICGAPSEPGSRFYRTVEKLADPLAVHLLGWREDITAVFAELDLLVIASIDEGMPRVALEAFCAGVPVIAYPVGGIPELISDGETGLLTRERSVSSLADRICEALRSDPVQLKTIAKNARRAWEQRYTVERYQNAVTRLMEDLVGDWRAAHGMQSRREDIPALHRP